jgi:hypothetical protein
MSGYEMIPLMLWRDLCMRHQVIRGEPLAAPDNKGGWWRRRPRARNGEDHTALLPRHGV